MHQNVGNAAIAAQQTQIGLGLRPFVAKLFMARSVNNVAPGVELFGRGLPADGGLRTDLGHQAAASGVSTRSAFSRSAKVVRMKSLLDMKRDAAALSNAAAKEGGALTCTNALNGSRSVLIMAFAFGLGACKTPRVHPARYSAIALGVSGLAMAFSLLRPSRVGRRGSGNRLSCPQCLKRRIGIAKGL